MNKLYKILGCTLLLIMLMSVIAPATLAQEEVKGPPLDIVYIEVRTSQETGIGDVATGKLDMFVWSSPPTVYNKLPEDWLRNINLIRSAAGYWSLIFNPVQDDPAIPGVVTTTGGEVHFNPFALREVRYAMNWLINRKYIIDQILAGGGAPMYTYPRPTHPAHKYFEPIISELGITPEGDPAKALKMIDNALTKAAEKIRAYGYDLYKKEDPTAPAGYWWVFKKPDGTEEIVTVKFYIRIEDERHEEGLYVADQIEKAGIKVERLERDRRTCILTTYYTDPKDYEWNIYTEGWVSMTVWLYPDGGLTQFYAPWLGWMPGFQEAGWWQYENSTIDEISKRVYFMRVKSEEEYWQLCQQLAKLGIQEAIRVFVAETWEFFPVSKRVSNIAWDVGSGLWGRWTLRTADTPDHTLRVAEFSAAGALFMSAWNPIGGIEDVYSSWIWYVVRDLGDYPHPGTAEIVPVRYSWDTPIEMDYEIDEEGNIIGKLPVDPDAVIYDPVNEEWKPVGEGVKAAVKAVYHFKWGNWHHGQPMGMQDIRKVIAFAYEWSTQDYEGDPYYDEAYASSVAPYMETIKGFKFVDEDTMIVWGDYVHFDAGVVADYFGWWATLPWEVLSAMEDMVANGGRATGNKYGWEQTEGVEWLDLLTKTHIEDLKASLQYFLDTKYIPPSLRGLVSWDEAEARYRAAIEWVERRGHGVISNGPFYIESYDPQARFMVLKAFRDPTYPFTPDYWQKRLALVTLAITGISAPTTPLAGEDVEVSVYAVTRMEYPQKSEEAAKTGYVTVNLIDPKGMKVYSTTAELVSPGEFKAVIPGSVTKGLPEGSYTIQVLAAYYEGGFPTVAQKEIILVSPFTITTTAPTPTVTTPTITAPTATTPTVTTPTLTTVTIPTPTATVAPPPAGPGVATIATVIVLIIVVAVVVLVFRRR